MRRLKQNWKLKGILRQNKETGARVEGMKDREVGSGKDNNGHGKL